jgi:hypothetical protein
VCLGVLVTAGNLVADTKATFGDALSSSFQEYDPFDTLRDPFEEVIPATELKAIGTDANANNSVNSGVPNTPLRFAETSADHYQVQPAALAQTTDEETLPAPQLDNDLKENSPENTDWTPPPLRDLTTNIVLPAGLLPRDYAAERPAEGLPYYGEGAISRGWPLTNYQWQASCFCHNPLYFEEINLERYGYGCPYGCPCCIQPFVSAAHFFATVPALPYEMAADCPWQCNYTLGHYRPGSCPPWRYHCCAPVSCLGAMSETMVMTGMVFLIP